MLTADQEHKNEGLERRTKLPFIEIAAVVAINHLHLNYQSRVKSEYSEWHSHNKTAIILDSVYQRRMKPLIKYCSTEVPTSLLHFNKFASIQQEGGILLFSFRAKKPFEEEICNTYMEKNCKLEYALNSSTESTTTKNLLR